MFKKEIPQNIGDFVCYDESSPTCLRWKKSRGRLLEGEIAGTLNAKGYFQICFSYKRYSCARIVYHILFGNLSSSDEIDHKDGNTQNNRKDNLRKCSRSENDRNRKGWASRKYDLPKGIRFIRLNKNDDSYYQAVVETDSKRETICSTDLDFLKSWLVGQRVSQHKEYANNV